MIQLPYSRHGRHRVPQCVWVPKLTGAQTAWCGGVLGGAGWSVLARRPDHADAGNKLSGLSECGTPLCAANAKSVRSWAIYIPDREPHALIAISMFDSAEIALVSSEKAADWGEYTLPLNPSSTDVGDETGLIIPDDRVTWS